MLISILRPNTKIKGSAAARSPPPGAWAYSGILPCGKNFLLHDPGRAGGVIATPPKPCIAPSAMGLRRAFARCQISSHTVAVAHVGPAVVRLCQPQHVLSDTFIGSSQGGLSRGHLKEFPSPPVTCSPSHGPGPLTKWSSGKRACSVCRCGSHAS
jgi:hypothetical protein